MIDLHSHILPGIDDGAQDVAVSLQMARAFVDQGVSVVACTPHILPGVYQNTGPEIRNAVMALQGVLDQNGILLRLVPGADNHIAPDFVAELRRGHLLTLADTRYVLVEPPHHVAPVRLEELFHQIQVSGYEPILTHPERLSWVHDKYDIIARLADRGVLMQLTGGSITGRFGTRPQALARRLLSEGRGHIVATDAHNYSTRPPDLLEAWKVACQWVGQQEADNLVLHRPAGILANVARFELPPILGAAVEAEIDNNEDVQGQGADLARGSVGQRLRRFFT